MNQVSGKLTVFFEDPFWVGVFERLSVGKLSVCKVTFGAEPRDYEVFDYILNRYEGLRFSPAVATEVKEVGRNPKRVQQEQLKLERKTVNRQQRDAERQRQFERKQQKRKEKHRGR